jgi:hypothetical protein
VEQKKEEEEEIEIERMARENSHHNRLLTNYATK